MPLSVDPARTSHRQTLISYLTVDIVSRRKRYKTSAILRFALDRNSRDDHDLEHAPARAVDFRIAKPAGSDCAYGTRGSAAAAQRDERERANDRGF